VRFLTWLIAVDIVRERGICKPIVRQTRDHGDVLTQLCRRFAIFSQESAAAVRLGITMLLDGVKLRGVMPESFAGLFTEDFLPT
jgi:hypothetical protein